LLHRDIKPSNIIACERGHVYDVAKLLDFGLVKRFGFDNQLVQLTQEGSLTGSPAYMSPEQALGKPHLDARSDIYSLGAVAYFLGTGGFPSDRDTRMKTVLAHAHEKVIPPSQVREGIPVDFEAVILRCLEKEPAARYPDAESLERALSD